MEWREEEILKLRSDEYLEEAIRLASNEKYDLAMSALHLHCELRIRSIMLKKGIPYPKKHSLKELIRIFEKIDDKAGILLSNQDYLLRISRIEEGYMGSRYFPIRYNRDDVEPLLEFIQVVYDRYIN